MKSSKEWYSSNELGGLPGMPNAATNVTRKAKKLGWEIQQVQGVKGVTFEYHISDFPLETKVALGHSAKLFENVMPPSTIEQTEIREIDVAVLAKIIEAVDILLSKKASRVPIAKKAKVIAILYRVCIKENKVDASLIKQTLELVS